MDLFNGNKLGHDDAGWKRWVETWFCKQDK